MSSETEEVDQVLMNDQISRRYNSEDALQNHLLEQYKLYCESAERISNRRQTANSFFVSINTALMAFLGYMSANARDESFLWLISVAGAIIAFMWHRMIKSYRDMNSAKFKVIHQIEARLPLKPFDAEWEAVGRGSNPELYRPFTHVETGIPWIFLVFHVIISGLLLPWKFWLSLLGNSHFIAILLF